jgi:lipopolysaccharide transport system ATP-binding protein
MADFAIRAEALSKKYRITVGTRRHDTLRDQIADAFRSMLHWRGNRRQRREDFWALQDVSFEIAPGEVTGVVGGNGAGKSTLLKLLSRITKPTSGSAVIRGRVGSLLEVGTGFHGELTGRENVYLNGAILGMNKAHIDRQFDNIVDFAEVEKFIDTPVKHYSSGMYLRLAFAVAAHLEPEILIVDEVLAVGDAVFQRKCLGKMGEVGRQGRTVLFVSHNMTAVRNLCSHALLLKGGRLEKGGAVEDVVRAYLTVDANGASSSTLEDRPDRSGTGSVRAVCFEAAARDGSRSEPPRTGCPADFSVRYVVRQDTPIRKLYASIGVTNSAGVGIFACSTAMRNADFRGVPARGTIVCRIDYLPLIPGKYYVNIKLAEDRGQASYVVVDEILHAATFEVVESGDSGFVSYGPIPGSIVVPHTWALTPDEGLSQEPLPDEASVDS